MCHSRLACERSARGLVFQACVHGSLFRQTATAGLWVSGLPCEADTGRIPEGLSVSAGFQAIVLVHLPGDSEREIKYWVAWEFLPVSAPRWLCSDSDAEEGSYRTCYH